MCICINCRAFEWSSELNSSIPVNFNSLNPGSLMFTLVILFVHLQFTFIHRPSILGSYEILFFTASNCTFIHSHIHNYVLFFLWLHLFFFIDFQKHIGYRQTWKFWKVNFSSPFSVLSFWLIILFMGFSKQEYWRGFPFPFSNEPYFARILHHVQSIQGGPTGHVS